MSRNKELSKEIYIVRILKSLLWDQTLIQELVKLDFQMLDNSQKVIKMQALVSLGESFNYMRRGRDS